MSEFNICEQQLPDVDVFIEALAQESANAELLRCPLTEHMARSFFVPTTRLVQIAEVHYV